MADTRYCDRKDTHEFHGWSETASDSSTRYHVCPGIPEPHEFQYGSASSNDYPRCVCGAPAFAPVHASPGFGPKEGR